MQGPRVRPEKAPAVVSDPGESVLLGLLSPQRMETVIATAQRPLAPRQLLEQAQCPHHPTLGNWRRAAQAPPQSQSDRERGAFRNDLRPGGRPHSAAKDT